MEDLANKIGIFGEDGGSNAGVKSKRRSRDQEDIKKEVKEKNSLCCEPFIVPIQYGSEGEHQAIPI